MTTLELASQAGTMATILDGRAVAEQLRAELRAECEELTAALGASPVLAVVIVGDDPASRSYLNSIKRTCGRIGIECRPIALAGTLSEAALCAAVIALNRDHTVNGVLVTLPLPAHLSAAAVAETLAPEKDIDGITPANVGRLALGMPAFAPNTPSGGMEMLRRYNIPIAGKHAVVVGRSGVVGKPMAFLLLQEDATVTICHRRTPDLAAVVRRADIVVTGAGRAHLIDGSMLQPGVVVVDFGINFPDWSEGKMVGDVDFASAVPVASAITPVPGGTGPVTNMMLMRNTLVAARALVEGRSPLHVG